MSEHKSGWIGVDFDGTLAVYDGWKGPSDLGAPIPLMVDRVKAMLAANVEVRIFTARAYPLGLVEAHEVLVPLFLAQRGECGLPTHNVLTAYEAVTAIRRWCKQVFGRTLAITCIKDFSMYELWDDRAIQVEKNTGRQAVLEPKGEPTP